MGKVLPLPKSITLKTGDGSKTVKAKVKDDVGNVSAEATVTVTLDTTIPIVTISAGQTKLKSLPFRVATRVHSALRSIAYLQSIR